MEILGTGGEDFVEDQVRAGVSLDRVHETVAVIEQFLQISTDLKNLITTLTGDSKVLAESISTRLEALVTILDSDSTTLKMHTANKLGKISAESKIQRLGIAGEVIRLRTRGESVQTIASKFGVSKDSIRRFLRHYDSLVPSERVKIQKKSVFDTTERLEELMVMIIRQINRLEGTNDDVAVKYVGELRQTLQLALSVSEKISHYNAYKKFEAIVYEILLDELPTKRTSILRRIQAFNQDQKQLLTKGENAPDV